MTDETWTAADDAAVIYESLPDWHPSLFVDVFRTGLDKLDGLEILRQAFVTPGSVEAWGEFSEARSALSGLRISTTPLWGIDAPDVAYVRLVDTDEWIAADLTNPATHIVTLVWRPEIAVVPGSAWRVHGVGDPIPPDRVPRSAHGFDPRKLPGSARA